MAQQTINVGAAPNDGTGTPLRTAFQYTNSNFSELYTAVGPSGNNIVVPGSATITGNLTVDTSTLKVDSANNRVGVLTATPTAPLDILGNGLADALLIRGNDNANCKIRMANSGAGGEEFSISVGYPGASNSSLVFRSITAAINRYVIDQTGAHIWATNAGTAMTLNSTGLGVGVSPSYKLDVRGSDNSVIAQFGGTNRQVRLVTAANGGFDNANFIVRHDSSVGGFLWQNNNGSNTLLTIDSSGNVGIGVTPSATWASNRRALQIGGLASGAVALNGTGGSGEIFFNSFFNTSTQNICVVTGGTGKYDFNVSTVGAHSWSVGTGTAGTAFTFTQAMTLDASGNLLVGVTSTTTPGVGNTTAGGSLNANGAAFFSHASSQALYLNTNADSQIVSIRRSNVAVGSISVTTTATAYNTSSDYRLKEAVQPLVGGLARVSALKPSIYKWKADGSNGEGFLAHELAEVVPIAVTGEKDAVNEDGSIKAQGVDLSKVVPILVAAIQELTARVQTLETR